MPSFTATRRLGMFLIGFVVTLTHSSASADVISIVASADGSVDTGTFAPGVNSTGDTISTRRNFTTANVHGIFEFDLGSTIPSGATINSATFSGYTTGIVDADYSISFTGYMTTSAAAIEFSDAMASGTAIGSFSTGELFDQSSFILSLSDLTDLQSAADGGNVFGIRSSMISNQDTWTIRSMESPGGPAPTLTVNFTAVPEPSSLFGIVLATVCFSQRRKR